MIELDEHMASELKHVMPAGNHGYFHIQVDVLLELPDLSATLAEVERLVMEKAKEYHYPLTMEIEDRGHDGFYISWYPSHWRANDE